MLMFDVCIIKRPSRHFYRNWGNQYSVLKFEEFLDSFFGQGRDYLYKHKIKMRKIFKILSKTTKGARC